MCDNTAASRCQVAVYYFPNWHSTERNNGYYGLGECEWKVVREARPRFPGHQQPKIPQWGYEDESLPEIAAKKIAAAADHGIDAFIWDWYWNEEGPFLHEALENGYLNAKNNQRLKFSLMWANHFPVSQSTFEKAVNHVVETCFTHPAYWMIDGKPYFSIYEFYTLIKGLGGLGETRAALEYFRQRVQAAGLPDLHLNAVEFGLRQLPNQYEKDRNAFIRYMGIDSVTSYVWAHNDVLPDFPTNPYPVVANEIYHIWDQLTAELSVPYHPNVSMGWDSWPRVKKDEPFEPAAYPRTPLISENTPEEFRKALQTARTFIEMHPSSQRILTINAWNEWTEGSYLEPDTQYGMGYLEAIQTIFG